MQRYVLKIGKGLEKNSKWQREGGPIGLRV